MIDGKRWKTFLMAYVLYLMVLSAFFLVIARDDTHWMAIWFHDRAYVFLLSTVFLLLCSQIDMYYHATTYIRIGSRRRAVVSQLLTECGFAVAMVSLWFAAIMSGLFVKFENLHSGSIADVFDWYGRYVLGLFLAVSISLTLRYSTIKPLRSFPHIITLMLLIVDQFVVATTLSRFSTIDSGLLFSWVFNGNTPISYIVLAILNALLAARLTIVIDKRDLPA